MQNKNLSVIVPVGPDEENWVSLLEDLKNLPKDSEIILVATSKLPKKYNDNYTELTNLISTNWIISQQGRAQQLNCGALNANNSILWFLHADSRISKRSINNLVKIINSNDDPLYYFDLKFLDDGPILTKINELGVWIRSHLFNIPFGDQGFCISKENYNKLKGYDENLGQGEDSCFYLES